MWRRGGVKTGESDLASTQFPLCSPQTGTPKWFMDVHREDKREVGDRGDQEEKRGSQKERNQSRQ